MICDVETTSRIRLTSPKICPFDLERANKHCQVCQLSSPHIHTHMRMIVDIFLMILLNCMSLFIYVSICLVISVTSQRRTGASRFCFDSFSSSLLSLSASPALVVSFLISNNKQNTDVAFRHDSHSLPHSFCPSCFFSLSPHKQMCFLAG